MPHPIQTIISEHKNGKPLGIPSLCTANRYALLAGLRHAVNHSEPVLIESTSNQVNQYGGYTGMRPQDFRAFLYELAHEAGCPPENILLGGDHLGPNPWQREAAPLAMQKAEALVAGCVQAGYSKIHLDASMPLGGDPHPFPVELAAERAAQLCRAAEAARLPDAEAPVYVIGTEVPPPGGAKQEEDSISVTPVEEAARTLELTRTAFERLGLHEAWQRVVATVVQPGVEYGDQSLFVYAPEKARALAQFIESVPGIVYEAHSTDYQPLWALRLLVQDHFAILKVGPALTFALREGIFALAYIEQEMARVGKVRNPSRLMEVVESVMLAVPSYWQPYYQGTAEEQAYKRRYSYSDRIRYYWSNARVQASLQQLVANLSSIELPSALLSQFLPVQFKSVDAGTLLPTVEDILIDSVQQVIRTYAAACNGGS